MAIYALVLKYQVISMHNNDWTANVPEQFHNLNKNSFWKIKYPFF